MGKSKIINLSDRGNLKKELLGKLENIREKFHPPRAHFSSINRLVIDMFNMSSDLATALEKEKRDEDEEKELEEKTADYLIAIELLCEHGIQRIDQMYEDIYVPICRILKSLGGPDYPDYELIGNLGSNESEKVDPARLREELDKIKH